MAGAFSKGDQRSRPVVSFRRCAGAAVDSVPPAEVRGFRLGGRAHPRQVLAAFLMAVVAWFSVPVVFASAAKTPRKKVHEVAPERTAEAPGPRCPDDLSVAELAVLLKHLDRLERLAAAKELQVRGQTGRAAAPDLVEALGDGDREVRLAAAAALDTMPVAGLRQLREGEEDVQVGSQSHLSYRTDGPFGPWRMHGIGIVANLLPIIRQVSPQFPGMNGASTSLPWPRTSDGEEWPRDPTRLGKRIYELRHERNSALDELVRFGPRAAPPLEHLFRDGPGENCQDVFAAIMALGGVGFEMIDRLLEDGNGGERLCAAESLSFGRLPKSLAPFRARLQQTLRHLATSDPLPDVRTFAINAVGDHFRDVPGTVEAIIAILDHGNEADAQAAAMALNGISIDMHGASSGPWPEEALPALIRCLSSRPQWAFHYCAEALGHVGAAAIPLLVTTVAEGDELGRWGAVGALGTMISDYQFECSRPLADRFHPLDPTILERLRAFAAPALARALKDERDPRLRPQILDLLSDIGSATGESKGAIVKSLRSQGTDERLAAAKALQAIDPLGQRDVPKLAKQLGSKSADERLLAAARLSALCALSAPAAPALQKALQDPDRDVRLLAVSAFVAIGPAGCPAAGRLRAISKDEGETQDTRMLAFMAAEMLNGEGGVCKTASSRHAEEAAEPNPSHMTERRW